MVVKGLAKTESRPIPAENVWEPLPADFNSRAVLSCVAASKSNQPGLESSLRSLRLGDLAREKKKTATTMPMPRRSSTPINFHLAPIEDGITLIINGLDDDDHATPPRRKEV